MIDWAVSSRRTQHLERQGASGNLTKMTLVSREWYLNRRLRSSPPCRVWGWSFVAGPTASSPSHARGHAKMTLAGEGRDYAEPHRPVPRRLCGTTVVGTGHQRPDKPSNDTPTAAHGHIATDATAAGDAGVRVVAIRLAARGGSARPGWLPQRHRPAGAGRCPGARGGGRNDRSNQATGLRRRHRAPAASGRPGDAYAHLGNLVPAIAEGKRNVAAGEALGHVARTGVTYGTHVFFAVLENGKAVDPLDLLPPLPQCGGPQS